MEQIRAVSAVEYEEDGCYKMRFFDGKDNELSIYYPVKCIFEHLGQESKIRLDENEELIGVYGKYDS